MGRPNGIEPTPERWQGQQYTPKTLDLAAFLTILTGLNWKMNGKCVSPYERSSRNASGSIFLEVRDKIAAGGVVENMRCSVSMNDVLIKVSILQSKGASVIPTKAKVRASESLVVLMSQR